MDARNLSDEKLAAILKFLVTFGYIDGTFDPAEQRFVSGYMNGLLGDGAPDAPAGAGDDRHLPTQIEHGAVPPAGPSFLYPPAFIP